MLDGADQIYLPQGFDYVVVGTCLIRLAQRVYIGQSGEHDNRDFFQPGNEASVRVKFDTVHFRHNDIAKGEIRSVFL
jgi:hypothetical protein